MWRKKEQLNSELLRNYDYNITNAKLSSRFKREKIAKSLKALI